MTDGEGSEDPSASEEQLWTWSNLLPNHCAYTRIVKKIFGYAFRDYFVLLGDANGNSNWLTLRCSGSRVATYSQRRTCSGRQVCLLHIP